MESIEAGCSCTCWCRAAALLLLPGQLVSSRCKRSKERQTCVFTFAGGQGCFPSTQPSFGHSTWNGTERMRDCPQSLMKAVSHIQILSAPCLTEVNFWERCFVTEDFPGTGVPTPSACSPHARPGVTACGCKSCPLQRGGMGRKASSSSPLAV